MAVNKQTAWGGFIIAAGIVFSVPVVAFFATGVFNLFTTNREGLELGIMFSIITLAIIWLAVFGGLWLITGRAQPPASRDLDTQLAELHEENQQLREIVSNLSDVLDSVSLPERQKNG